MANETSFENDRIIFKHCDETRSNPARDKNLEMKDLEDSEVNEKDIIGEMVNECENEQKNFEMMMASGGDYSPNSHTFFKQPFKENDEEEQQTF